MNSPSPPDESSYSTTAKLFHWVVAAVILMQLVLAQLAKWAAQDGDTLEQLALLANHKSLGLTALLLIALRIGWRLTHRPPPLPLRMSRIQRAASHLSHSGLYVLMLAMPVTGLVMSAASAYGLSWFNLFEIPRIMTPNEGLSDAAKTAHEIAGYALIAIILIHVAAAIYHHVFVKDDVLKRMSSRLAIGLFALLLGGLALALTPRTNKPVVASQVAQTPASTPNPAPQPIGSTLTHSWPINYELSFIHFTAEQAGAEFTGQWPKWQASISFIEEPLAVNIDVEIEVKAANTNDDERDTTLMDSDWFDVEQYPLARFTLDSATRNANGSYTGNGLLTIKNKATPVKFDFTVDEDNGQHTLIGTTRLDRLNLNVGTGEWTDTSWVGQYVDVDVKVVSTNRSP